MHRQCLEPGAGVPLGVKSVLDRGRGLIVARVWRAAQAHIAETLIDSAVHALAPCHGDPSHEVVPQQGPTLTLRLERRRSVESTRIDGTGARGRNHGSDTHVAGSGRDEGLRHHVGGDGRGRLVRRRRLIARSGWAEPVDAKRGSRGICTVGRE